MKWPFDFPGVFLSVGRDDVILKEAVMRRQPNYRQ